MIQSVVRALRILEAIRFKADPEGAGLVEIARHLGLEKATTYNLIKTLLAEGYVEQDGLGGKYRLGKKLRALTYGGLDDEVLRERLEPLCRELGREVGENVSLVAYRDGALKILCRVLCDNELVVAPNTFKPLYTTFGGRCLLAQLADADLDVVTALYGLPGALWDQLSDPKDLRKRLEAIRTQGMVVDELAARQLGGLGVVVRAPARYAPLALASAMPLFRFREKRKALQAAFQTAARKISLLLGEPAS